MKRQTGCRNRIIAAAEAVVIEAGAAHLTLDAVAAKAGVSKGGLLYHFPSKEALLQGMLAGLLERVEADEARFKASLDGSETADLEAQILAGFQQRPDQQRIAAALLAAGANNPKLLSPVREFHRRHFGSVARSQAGRVLAAVIMMAIDGLWLNELLQTSPLEVHDRQLLQNELLKLARSAA